MSRNRIVTLTLIMVALGLGACSKPAGERPAAEAADTEDSGKPDSGEVTVNPTPNPPVSPIDTAQVMVPPNGDEENLVRCAMTSDITAIGCELPKKDFGPGNEEDFEKVATFTYSFTCKLAPNMVTLTDGQGRVSPLEQTDPGAMMTVDLVTSKSAFLSVDEERFRKKTLEKSCSLKIQLTKVAPSPEQVKIWRDRLRLEKMVVSSSLSSLRSYEMSTGQPIESIGSFDYRMALAMSAYLTFFEGYSMSILFYDDGPKAGQLRDDDDMPDRFKKLARENPERAALVKTWGEIKDLKYKDRAVLEMKERELILPGLAQMTEETKEEYLAGVRVRLKYKASMSAEHVKELESFEATLMAD